MPKALIDTNVLLAACYGRRAWQSPLLTAWLGGHFDWVTSEALLVFSPSNSLPLYMKDDLTHVQYGCKVCPVLRRENGY